MPKTLAELGKDCEGAIGNVRSTPGEHRPELAAKSMDIIAKWAAIELSVGELVVMMMGANPKPAVALFSVLRSAAAQAEAARAVAELTLDEDQMEAFNVVMMLVKECADERHRLAHWLWGWSRSLPDALTLCRPKDVADMSAKIRMGEIQSVSERFGPEHMIAYFADDFDDLAKKFIETHETINIFSSRILFRRIGKERENEEWNEIQRRPRFQAALSLLNPTPKNKRAKKP